jgi:hypothetical protein
VCLLIGAQGIVAQQVLYAARRALTHTQTGKARFWRALSGGARRRVLPRRCSRACWTQQPVLSAKRGLYLDTHARRNRSFVGGATVGILEEVEVAIKCGRSAARCSANSREFNGRRASGLRVCLGDFQARALPPFQGQSRGECWRSRCSCECLIRKFQRGGDDDDK